MKRFFVSAGESSGDLLAALLVREIKKIDPRTEIWALGGRELKGVVDVFVEDTASLGVMGWVEPVKKLPFFWKLSRRVRKIFKNRPFDMVIPVDFYGFNIKVAKWAQAAGSKVTYYVSPQVWASRPKRLQNIRRYVNHVLCLFPFEPEIYRKNGISATFVGHPLAEILANQVSKTEEKKNAAVDTSAPYTLYPKPFIYIGLLPGSRPGEIRRHLPVLLEAWKFIRRQIPLAEAVIMKRSEQAQLYPLDEDLRRLGIRSVWGPAYTERFRLDLALTVSGLAALENMILGVPMVIIYSVKPAWLYRILRRVVKTPFIGMPNILARRELLPEFVWPVTAQRDAKAAVDIANAALELLRQEPQKCDALRQELLNLAKTLKTNGSNPSTTAAQAVFSLL